MNLNIYKRNVIRFWKPVLLSSIVVFTYVLFSGTNLICSMKLRATDFFNKINYLLSGPSKSLSDIVIISIDDKSYNAYEQKWPWPRDFFASLVYKLSSYSPRIIGLDFAFVGESTENPINDLLLKESFKDAGNIILGSYFGEDNRYIMPDSEFIDSIKGFGFTNKPVDIDNIIRRTRLFERSEIDGKIIDYSFDLKIACNYLDININNINVGSRKIFLNQKRIIPIDNYEFTAINYSAMYNDFKKISFADIMSNESPQDAIKDKIVLVGITTKAFQKIDLTPFGHMPSVAIIGNGILTFLDNSFVKIIHPAFNLFLILLFSFLTSIITHRLRISLSACYLILLIFCFFLISLFLMHKHYYWDFFSIPFLSITLFILTGLLNYATLLAQSIKLVKSVSFDEVTNLPTKRYLLLKLDRDLKYANRKDISISLCMLSIDNIQEVTSDLSAKESEQLLQNFVKFIRKNSRSSRGSDFIARYSEAEFVIILYNAKAGGAVKYIERLKHLLDKRIKSGYLIPEKLVLSAGIICNKDIDINDSNSFLSYAQTVLKRARENKTGNICGYDVNLDKVGKREIEGGVKPAYETDLGYVAEELKEKNRELREMIAKLRNAYDDVIRTERMSTMGKLSSTIHHDLNKPINNLRFCLNLIKDDLAKLKGPELEKINNNIDIGLSEIDRMLKLSGNLRDFYSPAKTQVVDVDVNQTIREMLYFLNDKMKNNKVELKEYFDKNNPVIGADKGELKQVFLNIISNAIEAMPNGGELIVSTKASQDEDGSRFVEITFQDTGCGISEENQKNIFKAFWTTKAAEEGTGLGLYSASNIVKKYGGDISVESEVNKGTKFTIKCPWGKT